MIGLNSDCSPGSGSGSGSRATSTSPATALPAFASGLNLPNFLGIADGDSQFSLPLPPEQRRRLPEDLRAHAAHPTVARLATNLNPPDSAKAATPARGGQECPAPRSPQRTGVQQRRRSACQQLLTKPRPHRPRRLCRQLSAAASCIRCIRCMQACTLQGTVHLHVAS